MITNLHIDPTFMCNYDCLMCGSKLAREQNAHRTEVVNPRTIKNFLKGFPFDVKSLTIAGGGEPTLYKELPELMRVAIDCLRPDLFALTTNGSLPHKVTKAIDTALKSSVKIISVGVSIDGLGKTQEEMRQNKESFKHAIELLRLLNKRSKEDKRIIPAISYTITPWNYEELIKVYYLSLGYHADFSFRFAQPISNFPFTEEIFRTVERQLETIINFMKRTPAPELIVKGNLNYLKGLMTHAKTGKRPYPCHAIKLRICVNPFGDVYLCQHSAWMTGRYGNEEYKLGNIIDSTLYEVLQSKRRDEVMDKLEGCEKCWDECSSDFMTAEYLEGLNQLYSVEVVGKSY